MLSDEGLCCYHPHVIYRDGPIIRSKMSIFSSGF